MYIIFSRPVEIMLEDVTFVLAMELAKENSFETNYQVWYPTRFVDNSFRLVQGSDYNFVFQTLLMLVVEQVWKQMISSYLIGFWKFIN